MVFHRCPSKGTVAFQAASTYSHGFAEPPSTKNLPPWLSQGYLAVPVTKQLLAKNHLYGFSFASTGLCPAVPETMLLPLGATPLPPRVPPGPGWLWLLQDLCPAPGRALRLPAHL